MEGEGAQGDAGFEGETRGSQTRESRRGKSRRGNHRRGSRVARIPQTWGSTLASKSGREENADASMNSASRRYKSAMIRVKGLSGRGDGIRVSNLQRRREI